MLCVAHHFTQTKINSVNKTHYYKNSTRIYSPYVSSMCRCFKNKSVILEKKIAKGWQETVNRRKRNYAIATRLRTKKHWATENIRLSNSNTTEKLWMYFCRTYYMIYFTLTLIDIKHFIYWLRHVWPYLTVV